MRGLSRGKRLNHLVYLSTQSRNVLYQNWLFSGFKTQWPSSGNTTSLEGTPSRCSVLKNSRDCVYGTRKSCSPATTSVGVLYFPSAAAKVTGAHLRYASGFDHGVPCKSCSSNHNSSVAYMETLSYTPAWLTNALKRSVCVAIQSTMYPPYEPPAAAIFLPSMKGNFASDTSTPFITSTYAFPPQSLVISSVNFCPYPVEPRRLIISVT